MKKYSILFILSITLTTLIGCSVLRPVVSDRRYNARIAAENTANTLNTYEAELDAADKSAKANASKQIDKLYDRQIELFALNYEVGQQQQSLQHTGRFLDLQGNYIARIDHLNDYLNENVDEQLAVLLELQRLVLLKRIELLESLNQVEIDKKNLKLVKNHLTLLSKRDSFSQQIRMISEFVEQTEQSVENSKTERSNALTGSSTGQ